MPTTFKSRCQPDQDGDGPAGCRATFTVDGQRGNQTLLNPDTVVLLADDRDADTYRWEVTSSPPWCDALLTGSVQPEAKLTLPGTGAYVVALTVTKGDCAAQSRVILWVATPRRLYRIPADSEALRFDGDADWAGDLAKTIQHVDDQLPTHEQKAAMDQSHEPGETNPFATLQDLENGDGSVPSPGECPLTEDEIAAIRTGKEPSEENPFVTESLRRRYAPDAAQKAALDHAQAPREENPLVTESRLNEVAPSDDQKTAMDAAECPSGENPFATESLCERLAPTADQRKALDRAQGPGRNNPFVTESRLCEAAPTHNELCAMHRAWDPDCDNPFVTASHLAQQSPTADQKAALNHANSPKAENPFVTASHMEQATPTHQQRAAMDRAEDPSGNNPFVTEQRLERATPTPNQQAALDGAANPGEENPFVTQQDLPVGLDLTPEEFAAIRAAQAPDGKNPFITHNALPAIPKPQLSPEQEAAIGAANAPAAENPFITHSALPTIPEPQLSPDQEAAIDAADAPGAENPFVTHSALPAIPEPQLSPEQEAAIDAANAPSAENPFLTQNALPEPQLTPEQKAAIDAADNPGTENPFITHSALPTIPEPQLSPDQEAAIDAADTPGSGNPFVTEERLQERMDAYLSADDRAAIEAAQGNPDAGNPFVTQAQLSTLPQIVLAPDDIAAIEKAEGTPDADNPFVTKTQLDSLPYLAPDDQAAIKEAEGTPSAQNPFVTKQQLASLPQIDLDPDDRAAIEEAQGTPSAQNPFVTREQLDALPQVHLDPDDRAAIEEAQGTPSAQNPFITRTQLIETTLPQNQRGALDNANQPSALNPFATLGDLGQAGVVSRVLAAGTLNLAEKESSTLLGNLRVIDNQPEMGLVTLTFHGYQQHRQDRYLIKALPHKNGSDDKPDAMTIVQFAGFSESGFRLQMANPMAGIFALGHCMVEVSEIAADASAISLEQAIRLYYRLIQQRQYVEAWPMLTDEFRQDLNWLDLDHYIDAWRQSGPAIPIVISICNAGSDQADYVLELHYPDSPTLLRRRYRFIRDRDRGHPRFGYWLFLSGNSAEPEDPFDDIWNQLTEDERQSLGYACSPSIRARFTLQQFQHGLMYWFAEPGTDENIWVLYAAAPDLLSGSAWRRYVDDWPQGAGEFSCEDARANGPSGPVRGFGWLWCKDPGVRERVGQPTSIE